jgi:hypothetical protein
MDAFNQQIYSYSCINVSCLLNANSFSTHYFANFHLIFSFCRNEFKRKQTGNETPKNSKLEMMFYLIIPLYICGI